MCEINLIRYLNKSIQDIETTLSLIEKSEHYLYAEYSILCQSKNKIQLIRDRISIEEEQKKYN